MASKKMRLSERDMPVMMKHEGGQEKVHKVMSEFKRGSLRSSSGKKVTNRRQGIAIAMSEAGLSKNKKKRRK